MMDEKKLLKIETLHEKISDENFEAFFQLLCEAFPKIERRTYDKQKQLFNNKHYYVDLLFYKNEIVGLFAWWDFETFIFGEHLAVSAEKKGKGFGRYLIENMLRRNIPVVGEVEPPETEVAKNRIAMYQHMGLSIHPEIEYYQYPLEPEFSKIPLILLTSGEMTKRELESCREILYREVYGR